MNRNFYLCLLFCSPFFLLSVWVPYFDANLVRYFIDEKRVNMVAFGSSSSVVGIVSILESLFLAFVVSKIDLRLILMIISTSWITSNFALYHCNFTSERNVILWYVVFLSIRKGFSLERIYPSVIFRFRDPRLRKTLIGLKTWSSNLGFLVGNILLMSTSSMDVFFTRKFFSLFLILLLVSVYTVLFYISFINPQVLKDSDSNVVSTKSNEPKSTNSLFKTFYQCMRFNNQYRIFFYYTIYENLRCTLNRGLDSMYYKHILNLRSNEDYNYWISVFNLEGMMASVIGTTVWMKVTSWLGMKKASVLIFVTDSLFYFLTFFTIMIGTNNNSNTNLYFFLMTRFGHCFCHYSVPLFLDGFKNFIFDYDELMFGVRRETSITSIDNIVARVFMLPGVTVSFWLFHHFDGEKIFQKQTDGSETTTKILSSPCNYLNLILTLYSSMTLLGVALIFSRFTYSEEIHSKINDQLSKKVGDGGGSTSSKKENFFDPVQNKNVERSKDKVE